MNLFGMNVSGKRSMYATTMPLLWQPAEPQSMNPAADDTAAQRKTMGTVWKFPE
jgi:hypothetical protein